MSTGSDFFTVSLRIRHDTCSPAQISEALGREAEAAGVRGSRRGGPTSQANWPWHYWVAEFVEGEDLHERVGCAVAFIREKEQELTALLRSGGRADIYAFIAPATGVWLVMEPEALATMARVGVELGIDVMAQTPSKVASE